MPHWRTLIRQIHRFDFSRLDYEIIGSIFERLIAPEERQKFGQFYTRVEVVDLINSFCIRTGRETIMDPACGGGTFLVRAYVRKRELDAGRTHGELLRDLFGIDVSHFATHLTTINLATRDLIDDENYPQIGRSDFFDVEPRRRFIELPTRIETTSLGKAQRREVRLSLLDAVVGNPPYIQQEEIPKSKGKSKHGPERGTKEYYLQVVKHDGAELSGRSDIHCYFWPHATSFLKDDGYVGFLTSSQWLDIEYGFKLQDWILRNFEIVAVLESIGEPWFVGARVVTAVTILHRQKDQDKRMNSTVRFVQLRRSVCELLPHEDASTAAAVLAADALRDEILSLTANTTNERYRARLVRQADLWDQGVALGILMGKGEDDIADAETEHQIGQYYGGKWGIYLRAPDIWFDLIDGLGEQLTCFGNIADVRFGVKTGKDCFFFPKDCTEQCLKEHASLIDFEGAYGVPRKEVESGRVRLVMCGEGRAVVRPIESKYLEPEVHSLMEVHTYEVSSRSCSNCILLLNGPRSDLSHYVREYVAWGESLGYHTNPTCASRATETREWYDLTHHKRPDIILPKIQQYRLTAFSNPEKLYQNSSLLGIYDVPKDMTDAVCAVLNSTIAVLSRLIHARMLGNEGNLQLDVYSAKMMPVPDITKASTSMIRRLGSLFDQLRKRESLQFISKRRLREVSYRHKGKASDLNELSDKSELDMSDRRELDVAVFEMLGVESKRRRNDLIDDLYRSLREFFELTRQKEEKAIVNRKTASHKGPARPSDVASQILDVIREEHPELLRQYERDCLDMSQPLDTFQIPAGCRARPFDMFAAYAVEFLKGKKRQALIEVQSEIQRNLLVLLAQSGVRGWVRIPHEDETCRRVLAQYEAFVGSRDHQLRQLVEERTADEDMQEEIYEALHALIARGI